MKKMKVEELAQIERITFRTPETDSETVVEYTNLMRQGVEFTPLSIATWGKGNSALVDGIHRLYAAMNAKVDELPVNTVAVKSRLEAELLAFKSNVTHGRLLSAEEKRKACIELLKQPVLAKLSNVKVAERLGVSDMTVKRYRDALGTKSPKAEQSGHKGKSAIKDGVKIDKGGKVEPVPVKSAASAWSFTGGSWSGGGADLIADGIITRVTEGVGRKSIAVWNQRVDHLIAVAAKLQAWAEANREK